MSRTRKKSTFKKNKKHESSIRVEPDGRVAQQLATSFNVVAADGENYDLALRAIRDNRRLMANLGRIALTVSGAAGEIKTSDDGMIWLSCQGDKAKGILRELTEPLFKAQFPGKPLPEGGAALYDLRPLYFAMLEAAHAKDPKVPVFGAWMWDTVRTTLASKLSQIDPLLGVSRRTAVSNADRDEPRFRGQPLAVMHTPERSYVRLIEDEAGRRIELQIAPDLVIKLVLEGNFLIRRKIKEKVKVGDKLVEREKIVEEIETRKDRPWSIQYLFHQMAIGKWSFQTVELNEHDGSLRLRVPYRKDMKLRDENGWASKLNALAQERGMSLEKLTKNKEFKREVDKLVRPFLQGKDVNPGSVYDVQFGAAMAEVEDRQGNKVVHKTFIHGAKRTYDPTNPKNKKFRDTWIDNELAEMDGIDAQERRLNKLLNEEFAETSRDLDQFVKERGRWDVLRSSVGRDNNKREAISKKLHGVTLRRGEACRHANHKWTSMIVGDAVRCECGEICVHGLPDSFYGHQWPWDQFKHALQYKAEREGITVTYDDGDVQKQVQDKMDEAAEVVENEV